MDDDDEFEPLEADDGLDDVASEEVAHDPDGDVEPDVAPQIGAGLFDPPAEAGEVTAAAAPAPAEALALYRRYRPDTFAQVIGQEHVTKPLQRALANGRVNHAYLFSGPRGCGKTTSARILARALNCERGPAAEPCGQCQSCRDLATGGPGSIDVIEIDAASHGGVDDARDLRERAFFAPVNSRYKIYIIDEAHMVTTQGFNALLKLVEEPPPHVKFIFATTEPDKVIGTIRSRTHHYPFRLVPPKIMGRYLEEICAKEGIRVESGVLPLVVRAGGGSVRDSLSVLDQLLGGASADGVTYEHATGLLGYTPEALLDDMVSAFAAGDGKGVFSVVDRVIEAGQDPRRFAEDLLRRLRDLVIVAAVPDALSSGLVDVAPEQGETYVAEAGAMGLGELTRATDVIAEGLTQMRGTTAPRLHLELMCARVLLPGADVAGRGINARLDRIERRLNLGGLDNGTAPEPAPTSVAAPTGRPRRPAARSVAESPAHPAPAGDSALPPASQPSASQPPVSRPSAAESVAHPVPSRPARPPRPATPRQPEAPPVAARQATPRPEATEHHHRRPDLSSAHQLTTADALGRWDDLLAAVGRVRNFTKVLLEGNASPVSLVDRVFTIALSSPGARASFERPREREAFAEAVAEVFGAVLQIETVIDPSAGRRGHGGGRPAPRPDGPPSAPGDGVRGRPRRPERPIPDDRAARPNPRQGEADTRHDRPTPRQDPRQNPSAPPAGGPRDRVAQGVPPRDAPPPEEPPADEPPPEDPWEAPDPREAVATVRPMAEPSAAPVPVPEAAAPISEVPGRISEAPAPRAPQTPPRPASPRPASPQAVSPVAPPAETPPRNGRRHSRYERMAAAGRSAPTDPSPADDASAYDDNDTTVVAAYDTASRLLVDVLGAELIVEEQDGPGQPT